MDSRIISSNFLHLNRSGSCSSGNFLAVRKASNLPRSVRDSIGVIHGPCSSTVQCDFSVLACGIGKLTGFQHPKGYFDNLKIGLVTSSGQRSHLSSWRPCKVKHEDSEGILSGESIILDEQTLEHELQMAIKEENYAQAAKIRDSLRVLHEDGKASVLAANARFYNSFKKGDLVAMQALWAKGDHVCCVHPGVSGIYGYDLVMGSWELVWADYDFPLEIDLKDIQVHVRGDLGYISCVELVRTKGSSWGKQFATNVFERIDGQWFICTHHASHVDL